MLAPRLVPQRLRAVLLASAPLPLIPSEESLLQGVLILVPAERYEQMLATYTAWFAQRDEVILVDQGCSSKVGQGYLLLEWESCAIDPLFLVLLQEDEGVLDFLCSERDREDC